MQAQSQVVNLSASSYYVPHFSSMRYRNYGAAVTEASSSRLLELISLVLLLKLNWCYSGKHGGDKAVMLKHASSCRLLQ